MIRTSLFVMATFISGSIAVAGPASAGEGGGGLPSKSAWLADVHTAMYGADAYLSRRAADGGQKLAIVTDVDNTALETHYATGQPTPDVLSFAQRARALGMAVLVDTGRTDAAQAAGALRAAGYQVAETCVRHGDEKVTSSKQRCRHHFTDEGYTIVADVGNTSPDMRGEDYERGFELPNYGGRLS